MTATSLAAWMASALVIFAIVPTAFVLAREAIRRRRTRAALERVAAATRTSTTSQGDIAALAASLRERFDAATIERTVEEMLRATDDRARSAAARLFAELALVDRYTKVLRSARRWSDRAHAAEVLGLAGASAAVPALVAAMNDRYEDASSVKAAATAALAKLRDTTAIPLLVSELAALDEGSARSVAEALVAFGGLAVGLLLELLADPTHATGRVWAARILGRIGDARATEDLVARLHDRDDLLRMAAAEALGAIADARAIQPLIRATLRDPAPQVRAHAAAAVARIEGERAIDVLVAALADPDYATRLRALEAFEAIRVEDTSHLESALRDPNIDVRRRAALALERVGYLDRIIKDLTSPDKVTRERAYAAAFELGSVGLLDSVVAYIHHESFEVRALVARICGELGVARIAPLLKSRLNDESWPVRAALVEALGRLKAPDTSGALVELLTDPEEPVREAAAEALTSFAPAELAPDIVPLTAAYDAGSVVVRTQVVTLVSRFEGDAADPLLVRASVDASDAVRLRAVTALGDRTGEMRVQPLVARLTDASLDVRMAAVAALGSAASNEAFEGLLGALAGAAPALRDRIAESLSRGARQQLFLRLDELEKTSSLDVRLGVAWTLGKCRDPKGVPLLARFLRDQSAVLRASAAGALAKISDREAREALLTAAEDPNGRVRAAVVNALGRAPAISTRPREDRDDAEVRIITTLERCTRDPDPFVRNRALVSLACVARTSIESRLEELGREAALAARLVAGAIIGTEATLSVVLDGLAAPGVLDDVLTFLRHEDPGVRSLFFSAVHLEDPTAEGPTPADVPGLVVQYESLLRTSLDVPSRRFAVRALGRLLGGRSVDVLADALSSDPAEDVRLQAAHALLHRRDDAVARKALVRAVGDPSPDVALAALNALAGRRDREVATALARRLGAGPTAVQRLTESTLADIHRDDPWPFLDWMMGVDVPELLVPAVRVLEQMASPVTAPLLAELVRSRSSALRAAAVRAIGALPSPDVSLLATMAQDPSEDVRLAVLETMIWTGESLLRANPLRNDPSVRVRAALAASLARFEGAATKTALKVVGSLLDDASPTVRATALATLMESDDPSGLQEFMRVWPSTTLDVRFELRSEARAPAVTDHLATLLTTSTETSLRRAAVTAMGALAASGVEERLAPALQDPSPDVRVAAIQALAALDLPSARARIAQMASDPDVSVREAARRSVVRTVG